jgi:arylsulfatase A-like enzyme
MKRFARVVVAVVALLAPLGSPALGARPVAAPQTSSPANIVLIVLDDVGIDALRCYNPLVPTARTPVLSTLAARGVKFTKAYSHPICSPTRATIMTGRYPFRTGMGYLSLWGSATAPQEYSLPLSELTIAEALKAGDPQYTCGAFGKWHITKWNDPTHAIAQGFDYFAGSEDLLGGHFNWDLTRATASGHTTTHVGQPWVGTTGGGGTWNETTFSASVIRKEATTWINGVQEPFFAYVCFNAPHSPWEVPPYSLLSTATTNTINPVQFPVGRKQTGATNERKAYDWLLEAIDTEIGRLITGIPPAKLARTTVIVVGDNGTPGAVIDVTHPAGTIQPSGAPIFYSASHAKGTLFEQGVRVPLLAGGYRVSTTSRTCNGLVDTVDIWRTVLDLANVTPPPDVVVDGVSFLPLLANANAPSARTLSFSQLFTPNGTYVPNPSVAQPAGIHRRAMNNGQFKYIRSFNGPPFEQAFNLSTDPLERFDLWPVIKNKMAAGAALTASETVIVGLRQSMIGLSGF